MSSVQSIERAFAILDAVANQPEGSGVTEIAQQVDLPKSTVARMLSTLEEIKAIERLPDSQDVRLGPKIILLAQQIPYSRHLLTLARPFLLELNRATDEAVSLCVPEGDQVFYVDHVQSRHHVQVRDWTGYRFPLHVVSAGKLFLSLWDEGALAGYLERPLHQYTAQTITDPQTLRVHLAEIRHAGVAWAIEEFEEGLTGISAPVNNSEGQTIAALNLYGPSFRFPPQSQKDGVVQQLRDACHRLSKRL